jgi:gas vesicle protein
MASRLLTGFALGMLAGMLLAPEKGSDTRKKISQKGRDLKNKFNDFVDGLHDKAEDVTDDVANMADRTAQKARAYSNEVGSNSWNG